MEFADVKATIGCLPRGRTLFHYFSDRYAAYILARKINDSCTIADLRQSSFGRLLQRPPVRDVVARAGDGLLRRAALEAIWPDHPSIYRMTLGAWGARTRQKWERHYHQTSRPGANLVLQLNFSAEHNAAYRQLIRPGKARPFEYELHPNARGPLHTLAWARIDIEYDTGEALIEEIQSDWVKLVGWLAHRFTASNRDDSIENETASFNNVVVRADDFRTYVDEVLRTHMKHWDEAMLTAALWFLAEEIGIHKIFYHDFDCGRRLKYIDFNAPPRSLYTELPRRFCFQSVNEAPQFLGIRPTRAYKTLEHAGRLKFWKIEL